MSEVGSYQWAVRNDATVNRMTKYGMPDQAIIARLAADKKELLDKLSAIHENGLPPVYLTGFTDFRLKHGKEIQA